VKVMHEMTWFIQGKKYINVIVSFIWRTLLLVRTVKEMTLCCLEMTMMNSCCLFEEDNKSENAVLCKNGHCYSVTMEMTLNHQRLEVGI
jgi:hypothetical protein